MTTTANAREMTAQQVARFIVNKKPLYILDVRNTDDYNDWKIEGERIVSVNIPYFELLDGIETALAVMPDDEPDDENGKVLVVCAKEGSAHYIAEQLAESGRRDVYYLQGGMKAWSEYVEPVKIGDLRRGGALYQFVRLGKGCLSYMAVAGGEAVVVDAVRITDVFRRFAEQQGAQIRHVIDTHLHADHISGGRKLAEQVGATYWLPPKDAGEVVFDYAGLEDGEELAVGSGDAAIRIQAVHSPGHTGGSTSLIVDDRYLLTGDILFVESIGRPDLAGRGADWAGDLRDTLYGRFGALPGQLIVLPAHFGKLIELGRDGGVRARLGDLYATNPGLNIADEAEFRRAVTERLPRYPNAHREIRQANMGRIEPDEQRQRDMEIGPNRCAVHDK